MIANKNLAAIHAYLCADGYVLKIKPKKSKKYGIGFRNTNYTLLKDFQNRFFNYFKVYPHLTKNERCRINSKQIHTELKNRFGSFHSREWSVPKLKKILKI